MSEFSIALRLFRSLKSWVASVAGGEVKERESPPLVES